MLDINWIVDDETKLLVTKLAEASYLIVDAKSNKQVIISYSPEGRMLFNGEYINTEDFMSFVGLLDEVDERIAKGETSPIVVEPVF